MSNENKSISETDKAAWVQTPSPAPQGERRAQISQMDEYSTHAFHAVINLF
jgi:hypothetical protein